MTQQPTTDVSAPKRTSLAQWYAIVKDKKTNNPTILANKSCLALKKQLNEQKENTELLLIVRGTAFTPKIKQIYDFEVTPRTKTVETTPTVVTMQ